MILDEFFKQIMLWWESWWGDDYDSQKPIIRKRWVQFIGLSVAVFLSVIIMFFGFTGIFNIICHIPLYYSRAISFLPMGIMFIILHIAVSHFGKNKRQLKMRQWLAGQGQWWELLKI